MPYYQDKVQTALKRLLTRIDELDGPVQAARHDLILQIVHIALYREMSDGLGQPTYHTVYYEELMDSTEVYREETLPRTLIEKHEHGLSDFESEDFYAAH